MLQLHILIKNDEVTKSIEMLEKLADIEKIILTNDCVHASIKYTLEFNPIFMAEQTLSIGKWKFNFVVDLRDKRAQLHSCFKIY